MKVNQYIYNPTGCFQNQNYGHGKQVIPYVVPEGCSRNESCTL